MPMLSAQSLNPVKSVPLTVEWKRCVDQIAPSFWSECFPAPYEGKWWYETLEQSGLEDQFTFMYGVVRRGDKEIAIAPAFLMDVPIEIVAPPWINPYLKAVGKFFPKVLYQRTLFVGSPCSDEGTIGLSRSTNLGEVVPAIQLAVEERARATRADMIAWKDFPATEHHELSRLYQFGLFASLSYPGAMVSLKEPTLESYYNNLKLKRRHNLKKKLKRSKAAVDLTTSVMQRLDRETLSEIWTLFQQTYEKGETKFEKLTPQFFELIAQKPASHFIVLREKESGKAVAFMLCFLVGKRVINKFIGLDYSRPSEWFLYFRLWEAALEWVCSTGAREFQSGQTGYSAKLEVGHALVPLVNYCRNTNPFMHELYRRVGPGITWSDLDKDLAVYLKAHAEEDWRVPS